MSNMPLRPLVQPRWAVIGTYRICPLPMKPIPPYHKRNKWPPTYLYKRTPIVINTDAANTANPNSPPSRGAR